MNSDKQDSSVEFQRKYVYFEKQSNDRLCGLHCLNSLLQGPYFDPFSMAEIAQQLDDLEKKLYEEDPSSIADQKPVGNVDDTGNYNVQVLSEALKVYGAEIKPVKQTECGKLLTESMDTIEAFIFNSSTHWFAIRKICNVWYNLNSTNPGPGPQIISDFYLSAFIKGTEELGYTNFLVENVPALADLDSPLYKNLQPHQKLVSFEDIKNYKPKKINMGDTDDQALERALELSKKEFEKQDNFGKFNEITNPFDQFEMLPHSTYENINNYEKNIIEQDDIKAALEMSMNEYVSDLEKTLPAEPSENDEHAKLTFHNNDANVKSIAFTRRFNPQDKISDLKNFVKIKARSYSNIRLMGQNVNKIFINDNETLEHAGIKGDFGIVYTIID